jgi:RNA polymerase sigma factor (sigma-70 family)
LEVNIEEKGVSERADESLSDQVEQWYREFKSYLFTIAYRMLGSTADAEDVVQDVFVALQKADPADPIRHERAYLARMTVNRSLNVLNASARKREQYIGPWLPEPLVDTANPLPDEAAERGETVTYAFMVLLEKLAPLERAVFVLRETDEERRLLRRFVAAFRSGRAQELVSLLAEDAILMSDGGGKVRTAINPIYGRTRSIALLSALASRSLKEVRFEEIPIAGGAGLAAWLGDKLTAFLIFDGSGEEEPIRRIYAIYNPDKLERLSLSLAPVRPQS